MKIITVVGARPQFIKAAPVSQIIRKRHEEILIHTGQHYDPNMSDIFFTELNIPRPNYNLNIGSGSHGKMTGRMLETLEEIYIKENPDTVLVYGDTNSTLAGALAASKLLIPVIHIEAGLRSFNKKMPEEQNRILTDHLSHLLFVPTETAIKNLKNEGIVDNVVNVGDVMFDAVLNFKNIAAKNSKLLETLNIAGNDYVLVTIHRPENTNSIDRLKNIIDALNECEEKIILPLHPRTKKYILNYGLQFNDNIIVIDPIGYLEMLELESGAKKIVTDSGGVQKEAYFMGKPCITMRDETEWIETVNAGWNVIVGTDKYKILDSIANFNPRNHQEIIFGDGNAAKKIANSINMYFAK